jgi:actin, other eukaryote
MPDGRDVVVGPERFRCPEALFDPSLLSLDCKGIHQSCFDSIVKSSEEDSVLRDFFGNIVLSGGTTLFEGLSERM